MSKAPRIRKWVLSPHAVQRMEERNVTVEELRTVLEFPTEAISQGPKWILAKALPGRSDNLIAAVVLERKEKDLWLVVTVMVRFERSR